MVEQFKQKNVNVVFDPFVGSGGFMVSALHQTRNIGLGRGPDLVLGDPPYTNEGRNFLPINVEETPEIDKEIRALTKTSITNALDLIENNRGDREELEKELVRKMMKTNRNFRRKNAGRVIRQFEQHHNSNEIGLRSRGKWIAHLKSRFQGRFARHQDFQRLQRIMEQLDASSTEEE